MRFVTPKRLNHMMFFFSAFLLGSQLVFGIEPQSDTDKFRIREELSIGASEGQPEYMFSRISAIAVGDGGRIYVLDYMDAELRVFDREGKHLRTIGRRGQGPGEFSGPFSLGITTQDTIMVHDLMNHRISYFSMGGDFVNSFSTAGLVMVGGDVDAEGNIISLVFTNTPKEQILELRRFDSRKNTLATYLTVTKTGSEATNNPLGPDFHWTRYLDNQVICGYAKTYELHVYDINGKKVRTIEHDYSPVRIDQDEIASLQKRMPFAVDVQAPKYRPAFQGVTADEDGRVFVATWERPESGKGFLYDVFDRDGLFAARIPLVFPPRIWKGSKLFTIEEDGEGYPVVKRYGVSWR